MTTIAKKYETEKRKIQPLFQVYIDVNLGKGPQDWQWNSPPKPLSDALDEAAGVRAWNADCPVRVYAEGEHP